MKHWTDFKDHYELRKYFAQVGSDIRSNKVELGRKAYSLSLAMGVIQAIHCGYSSISAVEIGVASGRGLLELCKAAKYFSDTLGLEIKVFGMDNATGLPKPQGYRDHPELFAQGQFKMPSADEVRASLPDFCKLLIGDASDLVRQFGSEIKNSPLAFVSVDVDFYSSAKPSLEIFAHDPSSYLPAVPTYFDDVVKFITYNNWCGEELAIREFNDEHPLRKIERNDNYNITNFHLCHVLDHPIRSGQMPIRKGFPLRVIRI